MNYSNGSKMYINSQIPTKYIDISPLSHMAYFHFLFLVGCAKNEHNTIDQTKH